MFPYADDTKSFSIPAWILILIGLNVLFFMMSYSAGADHYIRTLFSYGTIPARFFTSDDTTLEHSEELREYMTSAGVDPSDWAAPLVTLFTACFLHGGIAHLIGNMWFLWIFGDNVEDRMGKLVFPIFYILCGVIAGLLHVLFNHTSTVPAIGASGAIAGVMGAYIYLFPNGQIATLVGWGWYFRTTLIPASLYLVIWFAFQLVGGLAGDGASNVAFWAHIGGFVAGILMAMALKSMKIITLYPGDRGYRALDPLGLGAGAEIFREQTKRRRKKYVWHD